MIMVKSLLMVKPLLISDNPVLLIIMRDEELRFMILLFILIIN
jgi:hypothetical protein